MENVLTALALAVVISPTMLLAPLTGLIGSKSMPITMLFRGIWETATCIHPPAVGKKVFSCGYEVVLCQKVTTTQQSFTSVLEGESLPSIRTD